MSIVLLMLSSSHIILAVLILIAIFELKLFFKLSEKPRKLVRNIALVVLGISTIFFHLDTPDSDVFIDMRGAGVAIATLFGGVRIGFLTTVLEIGIRTLFGGSVWVDTLALMADFAMACVVLRFFVTDAARITWSAVALSGLLVGGVEALAWVFNLPLERGWNLFTNFGGEDFFVQFVATLLFGWLLLMQDGRVHGIMRSKARTEQLRLTLHSAVSALSTAMGHRDLATAGHERRVASLAVEIGKVLGMNSDQIQGLNLAATVHDVGLIRAPAEILTRPRKLSPEEFELLKLHAEDGYQILKEVPFTWPVAEIVYQHHENVDGSGYPRGLRGNQLLLEARILRVCDAFEAMTSHRPFRRAFTLKQALSELLTQKGSLFDEHIVDICVKLVREEGYVFPAYSVGKSS